MVALRGATAVSGCQATVDHGGRRRQQQLSQSIVESSVTGIGEPIGPETKSLPLSTGHHKWNKIEHRLFSYITSNWRGQPLVSREAIVNLIASTTTTTGLIVKAALDTNVYETGIKVTDEELASLRLTPCEFHGEWNYTIAPRKLRN